MIPTRIYSTQNIGFYTYLCVFRCSGVTVLMLIVAFLLKEDLYYPHPLVQDILWASLHKIVEPVLMRWPGANLREKAIRTAIEHIHYEDENTRYICIGPVNKVCKLPLQPLYHCLNDCYYSLSQVQYEDMFDFVFSFCL